MNPMTDWRRAAELVTRYADLPLGAVRLLGELAIGVHR